MGYFRRPQLILLGDRDGRAERNVRSISFLKTYTEILYRDRHIMNHMTDSVAGNKAQAACKEKGVRLRQGSRAPS
jgi:hypothetical protein